RQPEQTAGEDVGQLLVGQDRTAHPDPAQEQGQQSDDHEAQRAGPVPLRADQGSKVLHRFAPPVKPRMASSRARPRMPPMAKAPYTGFASTPVPSTDASAAARALLGGSAPTDPPGANGLVASASAGSRAQEL